MQALPTSSKNSIYMYTLLHLKNKTIHQHAYTITIISIPKQENEVYKFKIPIECFWLILGKVR